MTSPDGITWTARAAAEASGWVNVSWSPELNMFCSIANNGTNRVMISQRHTYTPDRVVQSTTPTPGVGKLMIWKDSDDSKIYIVYNDIDEGVKSAELT